MKANHPTHCNAVFFHINNKLGLANLQSQHDSFKNYLDDMKQFSFTGKMSKQFQAMFIKPKNINFKVWQSYLFICLHICHL